MAASTKPKKADLEEEIVQLRSNQQILESTNASLTEQSDTYWFAYLRENEQLVQTQAALDEAAEQIRLREAEIDDLHHVLSDASGVISEMDEELQGRVNQINYFLRVFQAIVAYKGENVSIPAGFAEVVLSEASEVPA